MDTEQRPPHGAQQRYRGGCRCAACRAGHAAYMRERRARERADRPPPVRRPRAKRAQAASSRAYFPGKLPQPVSLSITELDKAILDAAAGRSGRSRGDVVGQLLREHGVDVEFVPPQ